MAVSVTLWPGAVAERATLSPDPLRWTKPLRPVRSPSALTTGASKPRESSISVFSGVGPKQERLPGTVTFCTTTPCRGHSRLGSSRNPWYLL